MAETTQPRVILVHSESDLGNLIRWDLVKVAIEEKPEWVVYGGVDKKKILL